MKKFEWFICATGRYNARKRDPSTGGYLFVSDLRSGTTKTYKAAVQMLEKTKEKIQAATTEKKLLELVWTSGIRSTTQKSAPTARV